MKHSFGSDNHSGVHPEIMDAIVKANQGYELAYGDDNYTKKAENAIKNLFGCECEVFFVLNGTGANCTSLKHVSDSFSAVICSDHAHINVDECNAPEIIAGCRMITLPNCNGKISAENVLPKLSNIGNQHNSQPKIISISQPTEFGTLYSEQEIRELADMIHSAGGYLHVDGARIANAAVAMNKSIRQITCDLGVDILSFGGTKNGMMIGEAVVIFNKRILASGNFKYIRKQSAQLLSKMRYIGAQFCAYLNNNLYLKLAENANGMAKYLASELENVECVKITSPVETNAVFAKMPEDKIKKLLQKHMFYIWDEEKSIVRWMCSFSTTKEDIDEFVNDIRNL